MDKFLRFFKVEKTGVQNHTLPWTPFTRLNLFTQRKAQAFLELAFILPILLLLVIGVVEVSLIMGRYMDMLQLTREAARFASKQDPALRYLTPSCSDPNSSHFDFYYNTACIFSPPAGSTCTDASFCAGMNSYLNYKPNLDDVVISVYTVTNHAVEDSHLWAKSGTDENWKMNCQGVSDPSANPFITPDKINGIVNSSTAPPNEGFVAVEYYYCYSLALSVPLFSDYIPNYLRLHAYTIMPLPKAQTVPNT